MSARLMLKDDVLLNAGAELVAASQKMSHNSKGVPGECASITGIGADVRAYLVNVQDGRLALADAAKTGSAAVAQIMESSGQLDQHIGATLQAGFALKAREK